jgi:autotransporter-associated beta strand protein
LRFFALDSLGKGALRVEGEASLIPWVANISMGNPISIGAAGKLALETEMPGFTISGPISGNGSLEVNGRQPVTITGLYESSVALRGVLGTINFSPAKPVKLTATIKGGLLKTGANSLAEGSKLLITESGALAASGARDGLAAWVESGWIAPESTGTLALDTSGEVSGTIDLKPFAGKYPAMSLGSCGKVVLTGKLDLPGSVLRIGGGGGDIDVRTPLSGPLQVVIGAPSTSGNVTLSSANSFTGGLRIDGGTLRVGHAQAVPAGVITMGNRLTAFNSCQLDLNNFDLPNEVKFEGGATIKNSGRRAAVFSGRINAAGTAIRLAADLGSTLKVTGPLESQGLVFIGSDMVSWNDTANLVELAPNVPNTANRVQIDRGVVLRAVEGLGLPLKARLVLNGGVFESHGEFRRPLVPHYRAVDGEGGVSICLDSLWRQWFQRARGAVHRPTRGGESLELGHAG